MRVRTLALSILTAVLLFGATTARAQDDPPTSLRIFDVSLLVTPVRDAELETFGLRPGLPIEREAFEEEQEPIRPIGIEELCEIVRTSCGNPDSWDLEFASIDPAPGGRLLVRHTPEVLEQVASFLNWFDSERRKSVELSVHWLRFGDRSLERLRSAGLLSALDRGSLEPSDVAKVLAEVAQPGNAHQSGSAVSTLGRRVAVRRAGYVSYLRDYQVEIAQGAQVADPVTAVDKEGLEVYVRPRPLLDGANVSLEVLARAGAFRFPMPVVQLEAEGLGTLDLPSFETVNLGLSAVVRSGRTMSAVVRNPHGDGSRRLAVLLVTPRLTAREAPRPANAPEFMDCGFLSAPIDQFVIGWTERSDRRDGIAPGLFPIEDPEAPLELDALIDLIRSTVEIESWEEEEAYIQGLDRDSGWVIARNTRAVTAQMRQLALAYEARARTPLRVGARLYSVPVEALSEAGAVLSPGPRPDAKVVERLEELSGARLVSGLGLNAVSGNWTCGQAGLTRNYVLGYEPEVAQDSRICDPFIGQIFHGMLLNARPALSLDAGEVKMRIGLRLAHVDEESLGEARRTGARHNGVLHHPRERTLRYNGTVTMPRGGCRVLDGGADLTEPGRRYVIVLDVR